MRLEGWAAVLMLPPFETRPAGAPQGEVIELLRTHDAPLEWRAPSDQATAA